jgi:hypothetical protein
MRGGYTGNHITSQCLTLSTPCLSIDRRDEPASAAKGSPLCAMTNIRIKRIYEPPARSTANESLSTGYGRAE